MKTYCIYEGLLLSREMDVNEVPITWECLIYSHFLTKSGLDLEGFS